MVVLHRDFPARLHLLRRQHAILREERLVLRVLERRDGGHRVRQVGQSPARGFLRPVGGIAVAREKHALVGTNEPLQEFLQIGVEVARHGVELVRKRIQRFRDDRVERHLVLGAVLRRARGAELELVAREREGRGAVAVGHVARQRRQRVHPHLQLRASLRRPRRTRLDGFHHRVQFVAEEDGEDGRRRFVRTQAVIVAGAGGRSAQEVRMEIDRADDRQQHRQEDGVLLRI